MIAEIISCGTELLMGQIVDTNSATLSAELPKLGIDLYFRETVGDNKDRLASVIKKALDRSDIVFTIGGLGPTDDDITKETVAEVTGHTLELNEECLEELKAYFKNSDKHFSLTNYKQVMFPKDAYILKNPIGTAPGCVFEKDGKYVIIMPGPPREFIKMYKEQVVPFLRAKTQGEIIVSRSVKTFGISESLLGEKLKDLTGQTNPTVADYIGDGDIEVRVTAKGASKEECEELLKPTIERIESILGDYIYGYDDDTIPTLVKDLLLNNNLTISLAESCTGGLIAKTLTDYSGISASFLFGAVTYSNFAKMKVLGVKEETLKKHGAVSPETALEMVQGVEKLTGSDVAVSVTGIAGPKSDDTQKPVGLVYLNIYYKGEYHPYKLNLIGSRENIRKRASLTALNEIRKLIS
ncbi:MAG: competence/damage-inducible protein A [Abditibacteriota bacterium]|nr:competence/damage-inducible protein A [Abditibacteriota bacterium]